MTAPVAPMRPVAVSRAGRSRGDYTGALTTLAFALRRDRVRIAVWIGVVVLSWFAFAGSFTGLDDDDQLQARATVLRSPAMIMMTGPGYGLDDYSVGAALALEVPLWIAGALAVLSILQVVRHTRAEEESGRAELVRAAPVGRHAAATAAILLVAMMHAAIALLSWGTIVLLGDLPPTDALALTGGLALLGMLFAGVGLAAAQLVENSRTAIGLSLAVFGVAFALRAVGDATESPALGDAGTSWLSWLSPIAWVQQSRAFVELRWWPLGLIAAVAVVVLVVAALLTSRRDFDAGLVPARTGHSHARPTLAGPAALTWRTQRSGLIWTALGLGLLWFGTGTVMASVDEIAATLQEDPLYAALLGDGALTAGFFSLMLALVALASMAWTVASLSRLSREESSGRTEIVLAAAVSRPRWLLSQVAVSVAGGAIVLLSGAALMWAGAVAAGTESLPDARDTAAYALAHVPPIILIVALAAALYAWAPHVGWLAWIPLAWAVIVLMFADMLDVPDALRALSPLWWVPNPLTGDGAADGAVEAYPAVAGMLAAAILLTAVAAIGFRRRGVPA